MRILDGAFLGALETLSIDVQQMKSGHYSGARRSRAYGASPEFAQYRDYVPGDDLRRIDWNAAARLDKYLIKQFVDEKQGRNCIYLDTSASMNFEPEKGFAALRMAAALGYLSVCDLDSVSFRLLSGGRCTPLCERICGREAFLRAGERLEAVRFAGRADLGACLNADAEPGADDGVTFIISDLLTDSDWRAAVDRLLSRRREVMLIQVLSPAELEPKLSGRHTLCGAGEGAARITVDIDRDALRAYRETVRVFLSDIRHFCASRAVPYLLMRSDERVEHVLRTEGCMEGLIR